MPASARFEIRWFYLSEGRIRGPYRREEMEALLAEGHLGPLTVITRDGGAGWCSAASWPEFEGLFPHLARPLPSNARLMERHLGPVRYRAYECFAIFVMLAAMAAAHLTAMLLSGAGSHLLELPFFCCLWVLLGAGGGVKAVLFLRRSGRLLLALPPGTAAVGLVGAVGLVLVLVLLVVWLVAALAGLL